MSNITITDVRVIPGDSAFLVDDGKTAILYDSGFGFTGEKIADNIEKALGGRGLDYIFLTHSHYDHVLGAINVSKRWPNAVIVASEYAAKIFTKPSARAFMRELDQKNAARRGFDLDYPDLSSELRADIIVNDGDKVKAGDMIFTVVALPGHTKCSIGYFHEENKLMLGPETLGVYHGAKAVVPTCYSSYKMTLDSYAKAEKLGIKTILTPHFGYIDEETTKYYFKEGPRSVKETAENIVAILKNGGSIEDGIEYFKKTFIDEDVKTVYPDDAAKVNTKAMVEMLKREFIDNEE